MEAAETGVPRNSGRVIASPYARRLARERGIALERLSGNGPQGRILAADVIDGATMVADTVPAKAPEATPTPAGVTPAALAGSLPLAALVELLEQFSASGAPVALEDALLRAAALAAVAADIRGPDGPTILFEQEGEDPAVAQAAAKPVNALRTLRKAEPAQSRARPQGDLSLRVGPASGFAPVMLPLREGAPMRLVITPRPDWESAGVLFCFDPARIDEDIAVRLLKALGDLLGHPLRLFV